MRCSSWLARWGVWYCGLLALWTLPLEPAAGEARLLRFPAIHGDQIVFGYAGDLYTVPSTGGVARRLTSDESSYEMFPRFSPDGQWLAFNAQYDGNTEVYVMPAQGGPPRRLTYTATLERDDVADRMGPNNIVLTWRDANTIVYRSRRIQWNAWKANLTLARLDGGSPEVLPLPRGGWCSFSPDGKRLAYNRVFREFRTWKRYRGGQADEIWIHDFERKTTEKLTDNPAQDLFPMWHGDRIYFVSERDDNRQANLYVHDLKTGQVRQLTRFTEFAVKFPSLGPDAIVFENGGFIHRFDFATEQATRVPIEIREDFAIGRGGLRDVSRSVSSYDIAPDGARAVFGARGDIFTVPAKNGPTRNLTQTPGVHERGATWSPDGRFIAYVSDASGETEIWIRPQDGSGEPTQLTQNADTYKYQPVWSPDSKHLLWGDKKNRLQCVEVESRTVTVVDQSAAWEIVDFCWSPDSQWIAYTRPEERRFPNIWIYSVADRAKTQVTDGWFDVGQPEFSADGKYLFFVSERTFNPNYGQTEWNHVYDNMANIYFVTLTKDAKSPFAPKSDEVKVKKDTPADTAKPDATPPKDPAGAPDAKPAADAAKGDQAKADEAKADAAKDDKKKDEKKEEKKVAVKVDADGLQGRIASLPLPASTYGQLTSVGEKLYYVRKGKLYVYDFEKEKETELGDHGGYRVSADRKKMLVSGGGYAIIDLPTGKIDTKEKTLNLGDLKVQLDRRAEWSQIYAECWRQMRDFVYDPNLHGVDWPAMRKRYEPLLAHVQHRADLTYVIGEMIGEINLGHCYVGGGDMPKAERIPLGLLGATLVRHQPSGFYQITSILPGQNWDKKLRSPLTEIGVNVRPGDYLVAIDGRPTDAMVDVYAALVGKADRQVTLRVNSEPKAEGARDEVVVPIDDEQPLYYLKWVLDNIATVSNATDGKVGYVHVPDMGVPGLNEFAKFYYPQLHKEALIVDCRANGGGNVSPMIIERLRREPAMWTIARNGAVNVDPSGQVLGPKILLLDQFSASDGDIVGYRFRKHGLGPIIGMRSWGGVVGIRGSLPLLDGGTLNRPEFSRFDLDAKEWIMEGVGVEPDIVVDNDPAHEFEGTDDQLLRAIEEIRKLMEQNPVKIPTPPPYPNKSK
ncbi:MAG TPA: PDZ domain-containing protein [Verrucomicrobiota bacterium]|nr:PDZ domain-containing protein [Verrucomicrobiota bacterium]HNU52647.1 PDZ domain-containing protein [Verrucomicrobiota bacterium]